MQKLTELAEQVSTPERKVSPMQVAAQILENALEKHSGLAASAEEPDEEESYDLDASGRTSE